MRIGRPRIDRDELGTVYRVEVESQVGPAELWFRVRDEHADLISDRADAALLALVLPAMAAGEDLHVAGRVAARLHHQLSGPFQTVMRHVLPSLRPVRIDSAYVDTPGARAPGVATAFSGGVDSFAVLADHHYDDPPPGFRLTHLVFANVGSNGPVGNPIFQRRYDRLAPATARIGLPFVAVDSNLMEFYRAVSFKHSYTVRNASVSLLLQGGIGRAYHAAGTVLGAPPPRFPIKDIAHFDPVILPMVSTEALDALWVGGESRRVEKTLRVAEIEESYTVLDVCVRNDRPGNCSTCKKCVRTLLTLEIAGLIDRYAEIFDFAAYRRRRHWWVAKVLRTGYMNSLEIRELARERGYRFPLRERLIAWSRLDALRDWLIRWGSRAARRGRGMLGRERRREASARPQNVTVTPS